MLILSATLFATFPIYNFSGSVNKLAPCNRISAFQLQPVSTKPRLWEKESVISNLKYKLIPKSNHVSQISTIYIIIINYPTCDSFNPLLASSIVMFSADDWGVQSPPKRIGHLGSMKPFSVSMSQDP